MKKESFRARSAMIDEKSEQFLKLLVNLGGYCTVAHAEGLKLGATGRQARGHLRRLEFFGFVRRVTAYPVVYQVTKSATRHLGRDCGARRSHPLATAQARLSAVDFYLEARRWPAKFVFDHEQKIRTFNNCGCPVSALPQRGGKPYLREEFLFLPPNGRLGIAMVDQAQIGALSQMLGLVRRFATVLRHMGEGSLEFIIASGSQHRYYVYRRLLQHPRLLEAWPSEFELAIRPYCILRATPPVAALLCPACHRQKNQTGSPEDPHSPKPSHPTRRTIHHSPSQSETTNRANTANPLRLDQLKRKAERGHNQTKLGRPACWPPQSGRSQPQQGGLHSLDPFSLTHSLAPFAFFHS